MKKINKALYLVIPVLVIVLLYGFNGNVIKTLAAGVVRTSYYVTQIYPSGTQLYYNYFTCIPKNELWSTPDVPENKTNEKLLDLGGTALYYHDYDYYAVMASTYMSWEQDSTTPSQTTQIISSTKPTKIPTPYNDYATFVTSMKNGIVDITNKMAAFSTIEELVNSLSADCNSKDAMISVSKEGIAINAGEWISFNKTVYEAIATSKVPVTIFYIYEGKNYSVTIPLNSNVLELLNEEGYCGFLRLAQEYGFTEIVK